MGHSVRKQRAARALGVVLCLLGGVGPAAAQGVDTSGFAAQVLSLLNQERASNGLPGLREVAPLDASAQAYSEAMMRATAGGPVFLSHTGPDGSTFEDRINSAGYTGWTSIGENIAAGQNSPDEVVGDWMNSPGHRANILDPNYRDIGIGIAVGPGTWPDGYTDPAVIWWTTDFGGNGTASAAASNSGASTPGSSGSATPSTTATTTTPTSTGSAGGTPPPSGTTPTGSTGSTGSTTPDGSSPSTPTAPAATVPDPFPTSPTPSDVVQPAPPSRRTLYVTAFGARGDGVANDTGAIQAAIDTALPGDSVYFPTGTYRLGSTLIVRNDRVALWGDGPGSVLLHGDHPGVQAGTTNASAAGLLVQSLQFTGLPGKYQGDGNNGSGLELVNGKGATVQDCDFTGSGSAVQVTGPNGSAGGARLLNCRIHGWAAYALVLSGGERVDHCTLVQDDPDLSGGRSGSGILLVPGCTDVQVTSSMIQNARGAAVEIQGDASHPLTSTIDLAQLTIQDCRLGIRIDSSGSGASEINDLTVEGCSIAGTYGGAAVTVKQGQRIQIRGNVIGGGTAGLALGLWGPSEPGAPIDSLSVNGNTIRNCNRGIWAAAANGGSFTHIDLSGNSLSNCPVPLDLSGVPGY